MFATIVTSADMAWMFWTALSILFLIPFLSGLLSRMIFSRKVPAYVFGVLLGIFLPILKCVFLGMELEGEFSEVLEWIGIAFVGTWFVASAVIGVRTAEAFLEGLKSVSKAQR
ncbi:MAG: hypothetical protein CMO55_16155 [Verrucomicrobiales bacterium]|nr:hypothetical protein [Verrucomicrobiales bacterium]